MFSYILSFLKKEKNNFGSIITSFSLPSKTYTNTKRDALIDLGDFVIAIVIDFRVRVFDFVKKRLKIVWDFDSIPIKLWVRRAIRAKRE